MSDPLTSRDLRITDDRYGRTLPLAECRGCRFLFAVGPQLEVIDALYCELEDPAYEATSPARAKQMRRLVDRLQRTVPGIQTLLDVGAATGLLVAEAKARGIDAEGTEPSAHLVAVAARLHGVALHCGTLPIPSLHGRRFDAVTLVDVIEHVAAPVALLRELTVLLATNGVILLVTPDRRSLAARLLGSRWWHYRLAHVGFFDRATLTLAARAAGLEPIGFFRPGWYFPTGYLLKRLGRYLGFVARIERWLSRGHFATLLDLAIPLNLRDSWGVFLRRARTAAATHGGAPV